MLINAPSKPAAAKKTASGNRNLNQRPNFYLYVRNDPMNNVDPTGMCAEGASEGGFSQYTSLFFDVPSTSVTSGLTPSFGLNLSPDYGLNLASNFDAASSSNWLSFITDPFASTPSFSNEVALRQDYGNYDRTLFGNSTSPSLASLLIDGGGYNSGARSTLAVNGGSLNFTGGTSIVSGDGYWNRDTNLGQQKPEFPVSLIYEQQADVRPLIVDGMNWWERKSASVEAFSDRVFRNPLTRDKATLADVFYDIADSAGTYATPRVQSLRIVSHGSPGNISFSYSDTISLHDFKQYDQDPHDRKDSGYHWTRHPGAYFVDKLEPYLAHNATVEFYACDVGSGQAGHDLGTALQQRLSRNGKTVKVILYESPVGHGYKSFNIKPIEFPRSNAAQVQQ